MKEEHDLLHSAAGDRARGLVELNAGSRRIVNQQTDAAGGADRGKTSPLPRMPERARAHRHRADPLAAAPLEKRPVQRSQVVSRGSEADHDQRAALLGPALEESLDESKAVGRLLVERAKAVRKSLDLATHGGRQAVEGEYRALEEAQELGRADVGFRRHTPLGLEDAARHRICQAGDDGGDGGLRVRQSALSRQLHCQPVADSPCRFCDGRNRAGQVTRRLSEAEELAMKVVLENLVHARGEEETVENGVSARTCGSVVRLVIVVRLDEHTEPCRESLREILEIEIQVGLDEGRSLRRRHRLGRHLYRVGWRLYRLGWHL